MNNAARERAPGGEQEIGSGFAHFYRETYPGFVRFATLLTGSQPEAEDLVQEAFVSLADRYSSLDSPAAYMRTAVVNRLRSRARDRATRWRRMRLVRPVVSSWDNYEESELLELISRLPMRQRVVIVGRYWAGWSEQELATALGCQPGTVKSLASRALTTLRTQIEGADDGY